MNNKKRRAVIVLGMHRSGTSALAGVLGLLGAKLPARLMPATSANPKGYFESLRIVEIHDRILEAAGTTWSGWEEIPDTWLSSEQSKAFANDLVEAISEDYDAVSLFVVKDPRMCRLMPLWYRVLDRIDVTPCFAIPLRNPVEVAKSLQSRDGLPLAHGCLLWLGHVLDAERETRGHPRVFLRYQDLLAEPRAIINRIGKGLGIDWPRPVKSSIGEIEDFLDPKLRTQTAEERDIDDMGEFSPWLRQAYDCYEALVRSPTDRAAKTKLDSLHAAFAASDAAFTPVFRYQAEQHAIELATLRETLGQAIAERDGQISRLGQAVAERDVQIGSLGQAVADRDKQVAGFRQAVADRDEQVAGFRQAVAERDGQIASLGQAVAERDGQIASLGQAVAERDRQVAVQTNRLEEIFRSTGWRLLAPLRWYGRLRQMVRSSIEHQDRALENRKPDFTDRPLAPARSDGHIYRGSLIIPTKNGGDLFKRVVDGLRTQTCWNNIEFIVVDSGSTDETISVAHSAGAIVHTIPPNEFNHGATRDYGISLASNDYVVLMVQDAIPYDGFLFERLLSALSEEGVAGVYARQIPQPTADIITKRNLNSWLTGELERKVKAIEYPDRYESLPPMEKYRFCNFDNVCSAINKNIWKQEQFGRITFGEDIDWAERVLKRKFKIVYEPAAAVIHSHNRSLSYEYKRNYNCHRLLYRRFGLHLVPSLRGLWRAWLGSSVSDMFFVARKENRIGQKLRMLLTTPLANLLAAFGQYRAAQDEIRGIERNMQDV